MSYTPTTYSRVNVGNTTVTSTTLDGTSVIQTASYGPGQYMLVCDFNLDSQGNRTHSFRCYENGSTAGWNSFDLTNQDGSPQNFDIPMTLQWAFTVSEGTTKTVDVRAITGSTSYIMENVRVTVYKLS